MYNNTFSPHHPRTRKAILRQRRRLIFALGLAIAMTLVVISVLLLVGRQSLGWLFAGFSSPFFMLAIWAEVALRHIPKGKSNDINDLLSADCLAILAKYPTLTKAAEPLLRDTISGRFLATRFGFFPEFIEHLAADLTFEQIFPQAREVMAATESSQISGAVIIVAIFATLPEGEEILHRFQLDLADLYAGINWYNHLYDMSKLYRQHLRTGGIARDLNFGYIPTLQHFGQNISEQVSRTVRSQINRTARKTALDKMLQVFSGNANQNIALIGPEGSGKSIIVEAFASCLLDEDFKIPNHLRYRQIFKLDAAALLSATGGGKGQLEALLTKLFNEAYAAKNIIIYLNNAQLFFKDGTGSVDLTNLLQPIIEAGRLRIILSIEEQDFLRISAGNSGLANSLNRVFVAETDEHDTMNVMQDQVPYFENRFKVVYSYRALKEAYRLGVRYVADRAMPGRALRLLELGSEYAKEGLVTATSIQEAVEHSLGVKVQVASSHQERGKLLNLETAIHERMIGQEGAVATVSNALRRAAAGVRNEKRPIGTFLFLGPTGVGKTELAKAISEAYFGGEGDIIRLDLNEFVSEHSVEHLIATAEQDPDSLTAQISKRPFSVVLLDEIEKAHPAVLTTLLQLLDEGILRDIKNRPISFRDAIIIATSNAGADYIRDCVARRVPLREVKNDLTNLLISRREFKPEFLNRFDEICIFEPLTREELYKIVDLILSSTNRSLAPQKIKVSLTKEAKASLADKGYDPTLGARPLRRIVEKTVENIVAKSILEGSTTPGATLEITAGQIAAELDKGI